MLRILALAALALACTFLPRAADACSCSRSQLHALLPADGTADVPLNTRIWIAERHAWHGPVGLYQDDVEVRVERSEVWAQYVDRMIVLTPAEPLAPHKRYELRQGEKVLTAFDTGAAMDFEPPTIPVPGEPTYRIENLFTCGKPHTATWQIPHDGLLIASRGPAPAHGLVLQGPAGVITEATTAQEIELGYYVCMDNWPEAGPGASEIFRFGVFDLAGNFSGWSEPSEAAFPPEEAADEPEEEDVDPAEEVDPAASSKEPATGCSTSAGAASALALLLPLAALRRR